MELTPFDPATDARAVRACHEIYLAGAASEHPGMPAEGLRSFAGWLRYGWTEDPSQVWLARDGAGEACGWYRLTLPERENRQHAHLRLAVRPTRRRAGIGRTLVRHAARRADLAGRTVLMAEAQEGTPGDAFARALGARPGLAEINRVLRLATVPAGRLARLRARAQAAAAGYSLVTWRGPVPEDQLAAVAAISAAIEDAPAEDGVEPQRWDADRMRLCNERALAQGLRYYTVAARHDATGELAALTQVGVEPPLPDWAFQELTAVTRAHRGHRLGLLVKTAMLQWLAECEPQLTQVLTGNADGNAHMIAINDELGFEVINRWLNWRLEVAAVLAGQLTGTGRARPQS
jgi:GNAT superfamily N-acetyltransferase